MRRLRTIPHFRADCIDGPRPCPHVKCEYHLADGRAIDGPEPLPETCTLDVADRGGITAAEVAAIMGVTRQRIETLEASALAKLAGGNEHVAA